MGKGEASVKCVISISSCCEDDVKIEHCFDVDNTPEVVNIALAVTGIVGLVGSIFLLWQGRKKTVPQPEAKEEKVGKPPAGKGPTFDEDDPGVRLDVMEKKYAKRDSIISLGKVSLPGSPVDAVKSPATNKSNQRVYGILVVPISSLGIAFFSF